MFGKLKSKFRDVIAKVSARIEEKTPDESLEKKEVGQARKEVAKKGRIAIDVWEGSKELKKVVVGGAPEEEDIEETGKPQRGGFFKRIREKVLSDSDIENVLKELDLVLLENDVAFEVGERICDYIKKELKGKSVKRGETGKVIKGFLRESILNVLSQEKIDIENRIEGKDGPFVIMFFGFNGTGKTTTIAKVAHKFKKYKPVLAAGDTFRAASIEQLGVHASRLKCDLVKHKYGADPAAVIFDAVQHAKAIGSKLVLADTAGRSHASANLMDELKKIIRVNKPDLKVLVLDSLAGNDIYDQARLFNEGVGVDGIIMTKSDVYPKGGSVISASYTTKKPILFLGTGQGYDDLAEFDAEKIVEGVLD